MKLILLFLITTIINADNLKIYVFKVGNADSQLIVFPSGYSILIDLGEDNGNMGSQNANAIYVGSQIEQILGRKEIDVLVITHHHTDHHGYYGQGGIWYLIEKLGFTINKFIDRNCATFSGTMDQCSESNIKFNVMGQVPAVFTKFFCYSANTKEMTKLSKVREVAEICSTKQILPPDEGAEIQIIISDAVGIKDSKGKSISTDRRSDDPPPDENVYSIALRIQYYDFVYITSGDLTGKLSEGGILNIYDVESKIAGMIGEVDLYNANHHGGSSSTNANWCKTLKPTVSVISVPKREAGKGGSPHDVVLSNLKNVGSQVYLTESGDPEVTNSYSNTHVFSGDIIITVPREGTKFTVSKKDGSSSTAYNIKKNKAQRQACKRLD